MFKDGAIFRARLRRGNISTFHPNAYFSAKIFKPKEGWVFPIVITEVKLSESVKRFFHFETTLLKVP